MSQSIFISYSRGDSSDLAESLYTKLKGAGYSVWKDVHSLPLGSHFPEEISKNVVENDTFIVLLSKLSVNSDWVKDEINTAKAAKCHIIPILVEDVEIPASLQSLHRLDMTDVESRWKALHELVDDLGGESIPRVFNMSRHSNIKASELLILDHCDIKIADLNNPLSITENSEKLAQLALPYIDKANAGIIPPGHSVLASATLAYLTGFLNKMPQLFCPHENAAGEFIISKNNSIFLQKVRNRGERYQQLLMTDHLTVV